MRKLTLAALAAASVAAAGALTLSSLASAQTAASPPAPPPPGAAMPMPGMPMWMHGNARGPGQRGWMRGGEMREALFHRLRAWGLFHRPADLALTPDDVKIIGEAILLRHGQHQWKVDDVTPNADHTVSFAFVTAHGDVVARFAINTETGRISRTD